MENKSSKDEEDEEYECFVCNANLYVSLVNVLPSYFTICHVLKYESLRLPMKMKKSHIVYLMVWNI